MDIFRFDKSSYERIKELFSLYPECEDTLCQIITRLHNNHLNPLSLKEIQLLTPAIEFNILSIQDSFAVFTPNSDTLAYIQAREITKKLLAYYDHSSIFWDEFKKLCHNNRGNQKQDHIHPMVLILLSMDFSKDICKQVLAIEKNSFWLVYHAVVNALPFICINLDSLISLLHFFEEHTQHDLSRGRIYNAVQQLSQIQSDVGFHLFYQLKEISNQSSKSFIPSIIKGLSLSENFKDVYEQTYQLIYENDIELVKAGILSLSLFNYDEVDDHYLKKTVDEYEARHEYEKNPEILGILTKGYGNILRFDAQVKSKLMLLATIDEPIIKYQLSEILLYNTECQNDVWYRTILFTLSSTDLKHQGIIENLSHCLYNYYLQGNPEIVFDFWTQWVTNRRLDADKESFVNPFNWVVDELFSQYKELIEKYITLWFNDDDPRFHQEAADLVQHFANNNLSLVLNKKIINELAEDDIEFIILKIMGYVYWNTMLCTLVFSALQRTQESKKINLIVTEAFNFYISYNYPGVSREFLQQKLQSESELEVRVADNLLKDMNRYVEELNRLPQLKEFNPPQARASNFLKMKARKQSSEIHRKSDEGSILFKMMKHVVLKGGKSSFTKHNGAFTERNSLHEMSYSYELPRGEIFDPVGQQYLRYKWRMLRKDEVNNETNYT